MTTNQYRVMYKHLDGTNVCFAGPFEDGHHALVVAAESRKGDPLTREWWVEQRYLTDWAPVGRAQMVNPDALSLMPTADGGAVLRATEGNHTVRIVLSNDQTNAVLSGLLNVATIKILPEDEA